MHSFAAGDRVVPRDLMCGVLVPQLRLLWSSLFAEAIITRKVRSSVLYLRSSKVSCICMASWLHKAIGVALMYHLALFEGGGSKRVLKFIGFVVINRFASLSEWRSEFSSVIDDCAEKS